MKQFFKFVLKDIKNMSLLFTMALLLRAAKSLPEAAIIG